MKKRNSEVFEEFLLGKTYASIAKEYNVSTTRISYIVSKIIHSIKCQYRQLQKFEILLKDFNTVKYNIRLLEEYLSVVKDIIKKNEDFLTNAIKIDSLGLSVRTANCLQHEGIQYLDELTEHSACELRKIPNMGKKSVQELREVMARYGLKLAGE